MAAVLRHFCPLNYRQIKNVLAETIKVHRPEPLQALGRPIILKSSFPVAISGGRGSVNKRGPAGGAPVEEPHGKAKIRLDNEIAVRRGGIGDGAEMQDRVELAPVKPIHKLAGRQQVCKLAFGDIAPFIPTPSVSLTTMSLRPLALSSAIRFDPMNPAPPVTSNIKHPRRRQGGPALTASIDGDCATQVAPRRQAGPSYARERV